MNNLVEAFFSRLSFGGVSEVGEDESSYGVVDTLARVYEKARNALEYRADHLVRRAAIERILKRQMLFDKNPLTVSKHLLTELGWAKYLTLAEIKKAEANSLERVIDKYVTYFSQDIPYEWLIKILSAEVEDFFNLNTDYKQFTFFAFQVIKQKINLQDANSDLLIFFATDKVYAGSDEEQIAYHLLKLAGGELTLERLKETWRLFNLAKNHQALSRIIKFVRRQMPPLILLRDIYFYSPADFKSTLSSKDIFVKKAERVLDLQLNLMSTKITTAGWRSVLYVFLTKMIVAIGLEVPFEIFILGSLNKLPLVINLVFAPLLMWFANLQIRLPSKSDQDNLIKRSWYIINNFDSLKNEDDVLMEKESKTNSFLYWFFSVLYLVFFVTIFVLIYLALHEIGFRLTSIIIFVFFLTIIAFFAYRISQIARVYFWRESTSKDHASLLDIVSLPILAIGSRLSQGLSKLNFLAFAFDFILEAPFKIILGFIDAWSQFLNLKKEEEILE